MQYSIAATECFQFLWLENISILNNREAMITSSPPEHPQCRDSLDHQPRRHSYRGKPSHCQHCLILHCTLMIWGSQQISEGSERREETTAWMRVPQVPAPQAPSNSESQQRRWNIPSYRTEFEKNIDFFSGILGRIRNFWGKIMISC